MESKEKLLFITVFSVGVLFLLFAGFYFIVKLSKTEPAPEGEPPVIVAEDEDINNEAQEVDALSVNDQSKRSFLQKVKTALRSQAVSQVE